jgi:cytochrome c oxidase subunit IV
MSVKHQGRESGAIYLALLVLLFAGIGSLFLHSGPWQPVLPLLFAAGQAILVILFFMRVRSSPPLIWLFAGGGFLWLAILLVLVLSEYLSRPWFLG